METAQGAETCEEAVHASQPWSCIRTWGTWKRTFEEHRDIGENFVGMLTMAAFVLTWTFILLSSFQTRMAPSALSCGVPTRS